MNMKLADRIAGIEADVREARIQLAMGLRDPRGQALPAEFYTALDILRRACDLLDGKEPSK